MKKINTYLFSAIKSILLLTLSLTLYCGNVFASGTLYLNQDFNNTSFPPAGWTVSNTAGYNWIRTTYAGAYGTGMTSAVADFYDYSSGNFDLITPQLPVTTSGDSLVFDHAYSSGNNEVDRLEIYTSVDNGAAWILLVTLLGGPSGPLATSTPTYDLFVPTASQWATKKYSLPAGTNKIKFTGVTAYGNNLYLDNIKVGVPFSNDAGISSISDPKWGIIPQTMNPKSTVRNYGTAVQSFQVTMTINPGGYSNTQSVNNLAPGSSQDITFSSFNFSAEGNYTLRAYSSLASDQNVSNDTIINSLLVTSSPRNAVLEFCTGTWCQWCPCGDDEARHLEEVYPNSVLLAYHGAGSDPWRVFNGSGIISALGFAGYPSGLVDRRLGSHNGWGSIFTDAEYRYSQSPGSAVSINSTNINFNSTTGDLTVNLDAKALTDLTGQYKINYIITEDNLVYPQTGNSYCPGSSTWVHNWIVRNIVNTVTGDNINSGTWTSGQVYPLTFTTNINSAWIAGNCNIQVVIFKDNGALNVSEIQQGIRLPVVTTGIDPVSNTTAAEYELSQNYPNPFNPVTSIKFTVPKDGKVSLKIYDILGKLVSTYVDGFLNAGSYNAQFDGSGYASGIYFYTLSTKNFTETKKMHLIK